MGAKTKKPTVFEINGEKYDVVKRGLAQAQQVASATRWLSRYGSPALRKMMENDISGMGNLELAFNILGELDAQALVDLFQLTFGCSKEIAEQDFDMLLLVDGLVAMYNHSPMLRKLADRFFSVTSSESTEDINFMQSEDLTDG